MEEEEISSLVKLIYDNHPEIITYYELETGENARPDALTVRGLVKAYEIHNRYHIEFKTAVLATYQTIRNKVEKPETIAKLEKEYSEVISKM